MVTPTAPLKIQPYPDQQQPAAPSDRTGVPHGHGSFFGRRPGAIRIGRTAVTVIIAVLAVAGASTYMFIDSAKKTVPGTISLQDDDSLAGLSTNDLCSGGDGYADMRTGTQAVLMDSKGATIGTSELGEGRFDGVSCVFHFTFHNVPKARFYALKIGYTARGNFQSSYQEMVHNDWALDVSLGS